VDNAKAAIGLMRSNTKSNFKALLQETPVSAHQLAASLFLVNLLRLWMSIGRKFDPETSEFPKFHLEADFRYVAFCSTNDNTRGPGT
jgi:hypothetical protein